MWKDEEEENKSHQQRVIKREKVNLDWMCVCVWAHALVLIFGAFVFSYLFSAYWSGKYIITLTFSHIKLHMMSFNFHDRWHVDSNACWLSEMTKMKRACSWLGPRSRLFLNIFSSAISFSSPKYKRKVEIFWVCSWDNGYALFHLLSLPKRVWGAWNCTLVKISQRKLRLIFIDLQRWSRLPYFYHSTRL